MSYRLDDLRLQAWEYLNARGEHRSFSSVSGGSADSGRKEFAQANQMGLFRQVRSSPADFYVYEPMACLILQGAKEMIVGDTRIVGRAGDLIVGSHDLLVTARVLEASEQEPYTAIVLPVDVNALRGLHDKLGRGPSPAGELAGISHAPAEAEVVDCLARYLAVAYEPNDSRVLEPLIWTELHYRLLNTISGAILSRILHVDSHASLVAEAITTIQNNYNEQLIVADLAAQVGMSASSFHVHFKQVTGTTPLQYQKDMRLIRARRLLSEGHMTPGEVAYEVGYRSSSQFSREYSRKFGIAPRDQAGSGLLGARP